MHKNPLTYDILKEIFNISVGKSASILSDMINKKILLNVPDMDIYDLNERHVDSSEYLPEISSGALMVSSITFDESLRGRANLIFPAEKMRKFINMCTNEDKSDDDGNMDFNDMDFDIVKEIGNIILNSVIGEIGNFLKINLNYSLPEVKIYNKDNFKKDLESVQYSYILTLYISFKIDDTEINGAVIIELTLESLNELIKKVNVLEDEIDG